MPDQPLDDMEARIMRRIEVAEMRLAKLIDDINQWTKHHSSVIVVLDQRIARLERRGKENPDEPK